MLRNMHRLAIRFHLTVRAGSGRPRRRQAVSTVLRSRQAIVIGPTPPGTGVIAPATLIAASISTSPTRRCLPSARRDAVDADIDDDRARLDPRRLEPSPADRSPRPGYRRGGRSRAGRAICECASVTVQSAASSSAASGRPTIDERPRTTASAPARLLRTLCDQHQAALRRARYERRLAGSTAARH